MTDRELLERAAKAAGIKVVWYMALGLCLDDDDALFPKRWNPLEDDGDALRLAVKLGSQPGRCFQVIIDGAIGRTGVRHTDRGGKYDALEEQGTDARAATRRAITRAAAEMAPS